MKLQRYEGNTILSPNPDNEWESMVTTNPAAWYDENSREVSLLYRAAGTDPEHKIHFGLAVSKDGYHFERTSDQPVFSQPEEDYELEGYYSGVIFPCGKVVIDGTLFVYYGGADKYVGLATCSLEALLDHLLSCPA